MKEVKIRMDCGEDSWGVRNVYFFPRVYVDLLLFNQQIYWDNYKFTCIGNMLVLYWTRAWWSRVDDEKVKEGKRLIFPGLCSRLSNSRQSVRNRGIKRKRGRERKKTKKEGKKDTGTKALMEQRCFNQHGVGIYCLKR